MKLRNELNEQYRIVLVGTDSSIDKQLPSGIVSIHRTQNQKELAEVYSAADVFFNPTREEVLGLVNLESLACGTPVVTFNTGGSPECIDEYSGIIVEEGDDIKTVFEKKTYANIMEENCIKRAKQFKENEVYLKYLNIYTITLKKCMESV